MKEQKEPRFQLLCTKSSIQKIRIVFSSEPSEILQEVIHEDGEKTVSEKQLLSTFYDNSTFSWSWPSIRQRTAAKFSFPPMEGYRVEVTKAKDNCIQLVRRQDRVWRIVDWVSLPSRIVDVMVDYSVALYFLTYDRSLYALSLETLIVEDSLVPQKLNMGLSKLDEENKVNLDVNLCCVAAVYSVESASSPNRTHAGMLGNSDDGKPPVTYYLKIKKMDERAKDMSIHTFNLTKAINYHSQGLHGSQLISIGWEEATVKVDDGCVIVGLKNLRERCQAPVLQRSESEVSEDLLMFADMNSVTVSDQSLFYRYCRCLQSRPIAGQKEIEEYEIFEKTQKLYALNFMKSFQDKNIQTEKLQEDYKKFMTFHVENGLFENFESNQTQRKVKNTTKYNKKEYFDKIQLWWREHLSKDYTIEDINRQEHMLTAVANLREGEELDVEFEMVGRTQAIKGSHNYRRDFIDELTFKNDGHFWNDLVDREEDEEKYLLIFGQYNVADGSIKADALIDENLPEIKTELLGFNMIKFCGIKEQAFYFTMKPKAVRRSYSLAFYSLRPHSDGSLSVIDCRKLTMPSRVGGQRSASLIDLNNSDASCSVALEIIEPNESKPGIKVPVFTASHDQRHHVPVKSIIYGRGFARDHFVFGKIVEDRECLKAKPIDNVGKVKSELTGSERSYGGVFEGDELRSHTSIHLEAAARVRIRMIQGDSPIYYRYRQKACVLMAWRSSGLWKKFFDEKIKKLGITKTVSFSRHKNWTVIVGMLGRGIFELGYLTLTGVKGGKFFDLEAKMRKSDLDELRRRTSSVLKVVVVMKAGTKSRLLEEIRKEFPVSGHLSFDEKTRTATLEISEVGGFVMVRLDTVPLKPWVRAKVVRQVVTSTFEFDGDKIDEGSETSTCSPEMSKLEFELFD
jgi:hypothetical protein